MLWQVSVLVRWQAQHLEVGCGEKLVEIGDAPHPSVREEERDGQPSLGGRFERQAVEAVQQRYEDERCDHRRHHEGGNEIEPHAHQQARDGVRSEWIVEALCGVQRIAFEELAELLVAKDVGVDEVDRPIPPDGAPPRP